MKKNKMKKVFVIVMAAAMVFAITACGSGNETTGGTDGTGSGSSADANNSGTYTPELLDEEKTYYADIDIADYGQITVKLNQAEAPVTCANFVALAEDGFYDGLTFHRIMADFMMQGGDPEGTGMGGSENNIVGEFTQNGYENNITHKRGVISMARANDPNSASSQFFICHADSEFLDGAYAAFGEVTEGLDVVDAVCETAQPTDNNGTIPADEQPVMTSVKIRTE